MRPGRTATEGVTLSLAEGGGENYPGPVNEAHWSPSHSHTHGSNDCLSLSEVNSLLKGQNTILTADQDVLIAANETMSLSQRRHTVDLAAAQAAMRVLEEEKEALSFELDCASNIISSYRMMLISQQNATRAFVQGSRLRAGVTIFGANTRVP